MWLIRNRHKHIITFWLKALNQLSRNLSLNDKNKSSLHLNILPTFIMENWNIYVNEQLKTATFKIYKPNVSSFKFNHLNYSIVLKKYNKKIFLTCVQCPVFLLKRKKKLDDFLQKNLMISWAFWLIANKLVFIHPIDNEITQAPIINS